MHRLGFGRHFVVVVVGAVVVEDIPGEDLVRLYLIIRRNS
jgi:hypothetical protein